jgi:hypothetical protein
LAANLHYSRHMVTSATSQAFNAPAPPATPVTPADSSQASHAQFKDVYENLPSDEHTETGGDKPKNNVSKDGTAKKTSGSKEDGKAAIAVTAPPNGVDLRKAPLLITPSLGLAIQNAEAGDGTEATATESGTGAGALVPPPHVIVSAVKPEVNLPLPHINTLAFSVRLQSPEGTTTQTKTIQPKVVAQRLSAAPGAQDTKVGASLVQSRSVQSTSSLHEAEPVDAVKKIAAIEGPMPMYGFSSAPASELRTSALAYESNESSQVAPATSVHDVPMAADASKTSTTSEILLHLAGANNQSAAVRVVDRAGTVSVAVHASDTGLKTTLRSNLSDLATQLNGQGIKADVVKPAVLAAHADNLRDSHHQGERPANQQHQASQGNRQSPRQRRAGTERWMDELEKETTGDAGTEGGTP